MQRQNIGNYLPQVVIQLLCSAETEVAEGSSKAALTAGMPWYPGGGGDRLLPSFILGFLLQVAKQERRHSRGRECQNIDRKLLPASVLAVSLYILLSDDLIIEVPLW